MMNGTSFFYFLALMSAAFLMTGFLYKNAGAMQLIDIPNERSSHVTRTARGGGLSFVLCFASAQCFFYFTDLLSLPAYLIFFLSPLLVASLGFLDDLYGLSAKVRLFSQFVIVALALYWFSGTITFNESINAVILALSLILAVLFLVWFINLYNFMDGIDGLAAGQAMTVLLSSALFFYRIGHSNLSMVSLSLLFPVCGFFLWNFPKAKIFMGDVGSGFLGFVIGILIVYAATLDLALCAAMFIMNAVFVVDTGLTLFVRCLRGERIYVAHRNHAYQHAAIIFHSHARVTGFVMLINTFFLFPLASLCMLHYISFLMALILAYLPLFYLANRFRAGRASFKS